MPISSKKISPEKNEEMRIARFLAAAGIASRRHCEKLLAEHCVTVNGQPVTSPACKVNPARDHIKFDGETLFLAKSQYLLFHKPPGVTCSSHDLHASQLLSDYLPAQFGRLFTIGRLDRDSEGLIICTNDGDFAQRIAHPRYGLDKVYRVFVLGKVANHNLVDMQKGIVSEGEKLKPKQIRRVAVHTGKSQVTELEFILQEGRKREIRRLCNAFNLSIIRLVRIAIGPIRGLDLKAGSWRHLSSREITALLEQSRQNL